MAANELNTSVGAVEDLLDHILNEAEGAASQDQITYLTGSEGRRYAAIVPVECAEEYEKRFEVAGSQPSDVNTIADPYSGQRIKLGNNVMIQFGDVDSGAWFAQLNGDGELEIRFHSMSREQVIVVLPRSANSVTLRKALT